MYSRRAGRGEIDLDERLEREKSKALGGMNGSGAGANGRGATSSSLIGAATSSSSQHQKGISKLGGAGSASGVDPERAMQDAEDLAETPFLKAQTGREIVMLCQQNRSVVFLYFRRNGGRGRGVGKGHSVRFVVSDLICVL